MKILNRQVKAIEIIVWPLLTLFVEIMLLMHWPELTLKVILFQALQQVFVSFYLCIFTAKKDSSILRT